MGQQPLRNYSSGIPNVLIPSPYVTDDHQTKNAKSLVNNDSYSFKEEQLSGKSLLNKLDELMNHADRRAFMRNMLELGEPRATDQLIQVMLDEMKRKSNNFYRTL